MVGRGCQGLGRRVKSGDWRARDRRGCLRRTRRKQPTAKERNASRASKRTVRGVGNGALHAGAVDPSTRETTASRHRRPPDLPKTQYFQTPSLRRKLKTSDLSHPGNEPIRSPDRSNAKAPGLFPGQGLGEKTPQKRNEAYKNSCTLHHSQVQPLVQSGRPICTSQFAPRLAEKTAGRDRRDRYTPPRKVPRIETFVGHSRPTTAPFSPETRGISYGARPLQARRKSKNGRR